jgi:hypothetical protein
MEVRALPDKTMCDAGGHQIDGRWWPEQKRAPVGRPAWTPVGRGSGGLGRRWIGLNADVQGRRWEGRPEGRGAGGRGQRRQEYLHVNIISNGLEHYYRS